MAKACLLARSRFSPFGQVLRYVDGHPLPPPGPIHSTPRTHRRRTQTRTDVHRSAHNPQGPPKRPVTRHGHTSGTDGHTAAGVHAGEGRRRPEATRFPPEASASAVQSSMINHLKGGPASHTYFTCKFD
eukprot:3832431-Prymnesium_polylepis.2